MNAVLDVDVDPAPVAQCRTCGKDMKYAHLLCPQCLADGKRPNAADTLARNARITEVILWS